MTKKTLIKIKPAESHLIHNLAKEMRINASSMHYTIDDAD